MRRLRVVEFKSRSYKFHRSGWKYVRQFVPPNSCAGQKPLVELYEMVEFDLMDRRMHLSKSKLAPVWVGISHLTWRASVDSEYSDLDNSFFVDQLFMKRNVKVFRSCAAIIVFSEHTARGWRAVRAKHFLNFKVHVFKHPTEIPTKYFSLSNYENNQQKTLYQIGSQMRRIETIARIDFPNKCWLPGRPEAQIRKLISNAEKEAFEGVSVSEHLSDREYDSVLTENIVLLDVIDASANNTVIECMLRTTPLLARKHPAIVEYLGNDYPFYFENIEEANRKVSNDDLLEQTHQYMQKNVERWKKELSGEEFGRQLRNVLQPLFDK